MQDTIRHVSKLLLALYIAGALLFTAIIVIHSDTPAHAPPIAHVSLRTIAGAKLSSLFDGLPDNPKLLRSQAQLEKGRAYQSCGRTPKRLNRALSILGLITPVVHAQDSCSWNCGAAGCGGDPIYEACSGQGCRGTFAAGFTHCDDGCSDECLKWVLWS